MAVLNLRNVPEDLVRDLKKAAVDAGHPFHAFCLTVMRNGLQTLCLPYGPPPQAWDPGPVARIQAHDEAVGATPKRHAAVKVEIT